MIKTKSSHLTIDKGLLPSTGQYCIYKKGSCPQGLEEGYVYWDDGNLNNANSQGGVLPGGIYKKNTKINFCCKTSGSKASAVLLPSKSPFYLLAYKSAKCQMVISMVANLEWIYFDTAHRNNNDKGYQAYPHEAGKQHPTIYYCYYRGKETHLLQLLYVFSIDSFTDIK